MDVARPRRKGCGRRRIEIKKIENQKKRWVAFSKRKKGLLNKAARLSILSGEDIGVIIISEQGRVYTSENADAVIHRYRSQGIVKDNNEEHDDHNDDGDDDDDEDVKSGNGRVVDEQGLNPWVDILKIKDGEIKGENCLINLNKAPDDDEFSLKAAKSF